MKIIKSLIPEIIKSPVRSYFHSRRLYHSQAGQDFWVFGEVFNEMRGGFFLELGAHDGVELSNTYVLEKRYKWKGICVEANPDSFVQLEQNRSALCVNACLDASEGFVTFAKRGMFGGIVSHDTDNKSSEGNSDIFTIKSVALEQLLTDIDAPREIDYLSVDIEGAEERVLKSFPFDKWTFRCMTIERPTILLNRLLKDNHYVLIKEIPGLDSQYVHRDFLTEYQANVFSFYRKKYLAMSMS